MIDGIDAIGQLGASYFREPVGRVEGAEDPTRPVDAPATEGMQPLPGSAADRLVIGDSLTVESGEVIGDDPTVLERVLSGVAEMDGGYREITGRITQWPSFSSYLERHGISGVGGVAERDGHVSNVDDVSMRVTPTLSSDPQAQVEELARKLENQHRVNAEFYAAGLEYQRDSAAWYLGTEFWLTKVKVLTSAVSQVGRGLRTLFMSQ